MEDFKPLHIEVTANGYIVREPYQINRDMAAPVREWQVFESFDAMVEHLRARLPIYPVFDPRPVPSRKR